MITEDELVKIETCAERICATDEIGAHRGPITIHIASSIVLLSAVYAPRLIAEVRRLRNALEWYADERNYDEMGRPGNYVTGSTAGGFIQDPDWDTDDGWRAEMALRPVTDVMTGPVPEVEQ